MTRRQIRKILNNFFKNVPHKIEFVRYRKSWLVDIEYEDFLNVKDVMENIRELLGEELLINIKRECSESLFAKILKASGLSTDRYLIYNMMDEYEE